MPHRSPRRIVPLIAGALLAALATSGCTRNTLVLAGPVVVQAIPPGACLKPTDAPPTAPAAAPISFDRSRMAFPAQAKAFGLRIGCGGVLYHVDPAGQAIDAQLLTEFPIGYGFGQEALSEVVHMTFASGVIDPNWHFARLIMRFVPRASATPSTTPPTAPTVAAIKPWGLMN
jgi:hypothetical protein